MLRSWCLLRDLHVACSSAGVLLDATFDKTPGLGLMHVAQRGVKYILLKKRGTAREEFLLSTNDIAHRARAYKGNDGRRSPSRPRKLIHRSTVQAAPQVLPQYDVRVCFYPY